MDINRISVRQNEPNIASAGAVSSLRDKIKRARPMDDESKRRLASFFSDEEEESKDENEEK